MQNNKKLFELIASLSKSEKIYLKKFAFLHDRKKTNNYLELFNILQKQQIYDDAKLALALKEKSITKNLASVKHYLYKLILRSLRNYHHGDNASMEVKNLIADIHILYQRGLYSQCRSLISSTKKIVLKYDMYLEYYNLLKSEATLLIAVQGDISEMRKLVAEQRRVLDILSNSLNYQELSNETFYLIQNEQVSPNEYEKAKSLFKHPLLSDIKHANTFYDKSNFYFTNSRRMYLNENNASEYLVKNVKLWESNPHFIKDDVSDYLVLLQTLLLARSHNFKEIKFVHNLIAKIKAVPSDDVHIKSKIFQFAYMTQQDHSIYMGFFEEEKKSIPHVERELKKYDGVITYDMKLPFYFNTAYILFACGDFKASLAWINKALDIESKTRSKEYIVILKIVRLFIHLELQNFELFEFSLRSITRNQKTIVRPTIILLLDFLKKVASANSDKQRMSQLLTNTIRKLNEIIIKNPEERIIIDAFDFVSLLEAKLAGKAFAEIRKEKVQIEMTDKVLVNN